MTRPIKITAVSGSAFLPSRTLALVEALLDEIARALPIERHVIHLGDIARPLGAALTRSELPPEVESELKAIESAELLLVASPVYRGSFPGHLKHLFDLIAVDALVDTPVLLAATGGSDRHALVLEHQLRPLFGFLQALTLPIGVYGTDADFENYRPTSETLLARIRLAVDRLVPLLRERPLTLRAAA